MERAQLPVEGDSPERALSRRPVGSPEASRPAPAGEVGLGDVAKDVIDQVREIVSDSIAIGKLEAKRALERVEQMTRAVVPRVVVAVAAALLGLTGVVLGLIAIFIALGEVIPSVAVRLAIYAAAFLVLAAIGGFAAGKGVQEVGTESPRIAEK
jgi:hypothetical protein